MATFIIHSIPGFEEWKTSAKKCLTSNIHPSQTQWQVYQEGANLNLFAENSLSNELPPTLPCPAKGGGDNRNLNGKNEPKAIHSNFKVPRAFMELAQIVICYNSPERFALLYRTLWRSLHENRLLLEYKTDTDVIKLESMAKAVRRDAYKIKAFLRFREILHNQQSHFVAWYEPEHYTLELSLPFFQERFKNMAWSILTPYRSAHWNKEQLLLTDSSDKTLYPAEDAVEAYWIQYYASIFNPARLKTQAMLNQMPKKYWKHMPETAQIESLIRSSSRQVDAMISKGNNASQA